MVQKRYLQKVLKTAKQEAKALKQILSYYPLSTLETVYDDLPEEVKRYARPIVVGDEQFAAKWLEKPYKKKPFKKDAPEFYTLKHERVRSKSEIIIADRLNANGIPYKYECPLIVGDRIIHPDFTILRMSDRKILYHEHCGKLGDPAYVKDMIERSNDYTHNGIFIGDSLFYTFESEDAPLDVKALDELINKNYR